MKKFVGIFAVVAALALTAWASTEKVLWDFKGGSDGSGPWSNYFISDAKGNLYAATAAGGTYGAGVVFMLSPTGKETILYEFKGQSNGDGAAPHGHLTFDAKGNIYGTTQEGGTNGTGTVYELSPKSGGGWKEKVIYTFSAAGADGTAPSAGMTIGADGTMYSTTPDGGAFGAGTVFSLKKTSTGWKQTVIQNLNGSSNGGYPYEGLMMDAAGNLYGAAPTGGASGQGVIYRLSHTRQGWVDTVLHSFTGQNGDGSGLYWIDLISDTSGNIYGATSFGGTNGTGTVWELVYSERKKTYSEKILYEFGGNGSGDGNNPYGGLAMDAKGNLYGATLNGGPSNIGTCYKLTKRGKTWKETILHSFTGANDGNQPTGNPYIDAKGRLYGMTQTGGTSNFGIVYRITP
ncbi:MAG TPA: choice-of-anchor tandem repeat GloVer-containing protein [Terriglobales bacterium]|nr:choice-of-anchor tandem repeat GloVer-containing protein [Terriglobales bacterium]